MVDFVQDFRAEYPLVDPETGLATPEFLRFLQGRGSNVIDVQDDAAEALEAANAIADNDIVAGVGLSGGGSLADPTITIDLENTAVTPGSYTSTDLTVDAQGRITAAASGSGGGGGSSLSPPVAADFPLVVNYGAETVLTDTQEGLLIHVGTGGSGTQLRCAMKTVPASPFEAIWKMQAAGSGTTTDGVGFMVRDSAGGRVIKFALQFNTTNHTLIVERWNSVSSFNSSVASSASGVGQDLWFRYYDDGTTHYFQFSLSREGGWITMYSALKTAWFTTIDEIGFGVEDQGLTDYQLLIEHYEQA